MALQPKETGLMEIARCLASGTGMAAEVLPEKPFPDLPKVSRDWTQADSLAGYIRTLKFPVEKTAAICVVTDALVFEYGHIHNPCWISNLHPKTFPAAKEPPIIILSRQLLFSRHFILESVAVKAKKSGYEILSVPRYGKYLLGALAVAGTRDHQCWTYGCPATVAEGMAVESRCSYWLCPKCRAEMAEFYR